MGSYAIPSDEIEDFKTIPIAREIPTTHDIQLYKSFSDIPTHTYVENTEPGRISDVEVELYPFRSITGISDENDIEEEEKSVEEDERIREEEYTEDEETQNDKTAAAEEHRESLHLDESQRKAKPSTQSIEASFLLRLSSELPRTSRNPLSDYRESVTVEKPTLSTKDRPTSAEKRRSTAVKFSR
uniref:Uncharacterized protein n=1 Tax=Glossina austeni TaxID=7395 RepID=A0A1A9UMF9_GLOAU